MLDILGHLLYQFFSVKQEFMVHEDAGFAYQLQSEESKYIYNLHWAVIGGDYFRGR